MAKVTEKQLKELATTLNTGFLKETAAGIRVSRDSDGYAIILMYRDGGNQAAIESGLTASEAYGCIQGFVKGVELGMQAKHVYCPKCKAKATLVPEDEYTKEHIFCPVCGQRSRR